MGWNDHLDDSELANLPPEAYGNKFDVDGPFDPEDFWLESADRDDQLIAVKEWFLARYWDPANDTPYNGREGGYLFIHGGPYDPADEIHERFDGVVDDEVLEEAIDELHGMPPGDAWAPIQTSMDYDDYLTLEPEDRDAPVLSFNTRIEQINQVLVFALLSEAYTQPLIRQMVFESIISAIEAFFAETVMYWVKNDKGVMRRVVAREFKDRKINLGEIFDQMDKIENEVLVHLTNQVWHRLDKLKPTIEAGLEIELPDIKPIMMAIEKRHDIVHRAGKTKDGTPISVEHEDLDALRSEAESIVESVCAGLEVRFPR